MFGPIPVFERQTYVSQAGGDTESYPSEPITQIARSSKVLFVSVLLEDFSSTDGRVSIHLQDSNDGRNWADRETLVNNATKNLDENEYQIVATTNDFGPIVRLVLEVSDNLTTSEQTVVARVEVSGKPF